MTNKHTKISTLLKTIDGIEYIQAVLFEANSASHYGNIFNAKRKASK